MEPGVKLLVEAATKMDINLEIVSKSLFLYHAFKRIVDNVEYDDGMVAAAALNITSRVCGEAIDLDLIVLYFYINVTHSEKIPDDEKVLTRLKKSVIAVDYIMIRMLEFNLNNEIAHQYFQPFLTMLCSRSQPIRDATRKLTLTCFRLMNDFYTHSQCIEFEPDHITAGCIHFALEVHELFGGLVTVDSWYEGLSDDLTTDIIEELKDIITEVYVEDSGPEFEESSGIKEVCLDGTEEATEKTDTVPEGEETSSVTKEAIPKGPGATSDVSAMDSGEIEIMDKEPEMTTEVVPEEDELSFLSLCPDDISPEKISSTNIDPRETSPLEMEVDLNIRVPELRGLPFKEKDIFCLDVLPNRLPPERIEIDLTEKDPKQKEVSFQERMKSLESLCQSEIAPPKIRMGLNKRAPKKVLSPEKGKDMPSEITSKEIPPQPKQIWPEEIVIDD